MTYQLFADDVLVWQHTTLPTQRDIDRAATEANARGWNGTQLELRIDGRYEGLVDPREGVLV